MTDPGTDSPTPFNSAAPEAPGAAPGAGSPAPGLAEAQAAVEASRRDAAENYERFLRVTADLENYRKRAIREREELRTQVASRLLEDFLPVLDNLSLGVAAARQPGADLNTLTGGVDLVLQQLRSLLTKHGLVEINPVGEAFDPHRQEAISHLPSAEVKAEHVLTVVRTGFLLNGRLLRPASVVVSSGSVAAEPVI